MFTWLIKDFKSLQDRRIQSEEFNVDGCTWSLLVYPNGTAREKNVSVFLLVTNYQDLPPGWKITAKFSLCIANSSYHRRALAGGEKCFHGKGPSWGKDYWLHHSQLNDGFLVNGDLMIVAEVEVLEKSGVETQEVIDIDDQHLQSFLF